MHTPIITLTTDYGTRDHYVGSLKGAILSILPEARLVDISHEVEAHNVVHGAFILRQIWPWYPAGTIHLVVVDPGVGTDRRIILGQYAGRYVMAPDNGLITFVHREFSLERMFVVENRKLMGSALSATFHGRDVMAPVAAHLAKGVDPKEVGRLTDEVAMLSIPHRAEAVGGSLRGVVLYVDHFGTLVTNVRKEQVDGLTGATAVVEVTIDGVVLGPIHPTFSSVAVGEPVALIGGGGQLEIAINQGSAVERFGRDVSIGVAVG